MREVEQALIARAKGGDTAAFGRLVSMHQSPVRVFLRRTLRGDAATADDLAQETFIRAWGRIGQYSGEGRFLSWLFRIAYREVLMHARKQKVTELLEPDMAADTRSGDVANARAELERLMRFVSGPERAALTLCYAFEMTHGEAADILGLPLGTVKSHIARARDKLQALASSQEELTS